MSKKESMKTYSAEALRTMIARGEDRSDIAAVKAKTQEEIERDAANDHDDDVSVDWSQVEVTMPRNKQGVFLRLDAEILEHFKQDGSGYQTRINAVLRAYVEQQNKLRIKRAG